MTKSEYKKSIEDLEQKYKQDKKLLAIRFATSNNPHSVGDIIEDHSTKIRVQKMTVSLGFLNSLPCMVYFGVILNKNNSEKKPSKIGEIHQSNILK